MAHPLATEPLPHASSERYAGSRHLGVLPMGCIQCREGAKLVLFITGLCDKECFYCPVSRDKMYRDVVYANERRIHIGEWEPLLEECRFTGAKGAGITGGDPMVVPDRVVELVTLLKGEFGPDFHTHLYTSCAFDVAELDRLRAAGLDEIRFHPELREYKDMPNSWHDEAIRRAIQLGFTTMVEIPAVPGKEEDILALASYLAEVGAHGLNMNELEFSDPNIASLKRFGYEPRDDESQRVAGSRETALAVLEAWKARGPSGHGAPGAAARGSPSGATAAGGSPPGAAATAAPGPGTPSAAAPSSRPAFAVHFCSSPYKDAIQLMQRLRRRAERTARPFEEQTEEGTLVLGVLRSTRGESPGIVAETLRAEYEVPPEWIVVDGDRIETAPAVAEELADAGVLEALGLDAWLSEVYPTADRLEVERVPLGR